MEWITERLLSMKEESYKRFTAALIPTVTPDRIIGVRIPALRAYAKEIAGSEAAEAFLQTLPHFYCEENHLHAFLIERIGDYEKTIAALDAFLPFVDNWATCDSLSPKCFRRHRKELRGEIDRWIVSSHPYAVRFAIKLLMTEYLDDSFLPSDPARLAEIQPDEYYIRMMIAWYFATALAKRYDDILPYLRGNRMDPKTRAMAIRKALESYRITDEQKAELRMTVREKRV